MIVEVVLYALRCLIGAATRTIAKPATDLSVCHKHESIQDRRCWLLIIPPGHARNESSQNGSCELCSLSGEMKEGPVNPGIIVGTPHWMGAETRDWEAYAK